MTPVFDVFLAPLRHLGSVIWLGIDTVQESWSYFLSGRAPVRRAVLFAHAERAGVGSIPLVAMISFFLGLTMALLTGYQLRKFGSTNLVPGLVAVGFLRELGPLMTGIVLAARIGASFTAELGTMMVSEEVEAIEAMGIGPLRFLVAPRVLAVFLLMPSLNVVSNVAANAGAAAVGYVHFDITLYYFQQLVLDNIILRDVVSGTLKSLLFGLIIGLFSCYNGLTVTGGGGGWGAATTASVVAAITTVIGADTLFNLGLVLIYGQ